MVEQWPFKPLVTGSSPVGGIMEKKWVRINHVDGTQKVFFMVRTRPKCFDMASSELTEQIEENIQRCQEEIALWEELLEHQKDWINGE